MILLSPLCLVLLGTLPQDRTDDLRRFLSHYAAGRIDAAQVQKLFKSIDPDPLFPALERALSKVSEHPDEAAFQAILDIATFRFDEDPERELRQHATRQPWVVRRRAIDELRQRYTSPAMQNVALAWLEDPSTAPAKRRVLIEVLGAAHAVRSHEATHGRLLAALKDSDSTVRGLAAEGLGATAKASDNLELARLLFDADAEVRLCAVRALTAALPRTVHELDDARRTQILRLFATRLLDEDPHVRLLSAEGLSQVPDPCLLEPMLDALEAEEGRHGTAAARLRLRVAVENAIHRITGVGAPPRSAAEWRTLVKEREKLASAEATEDGSPRTIASGPDPIPRKYATYFGRDVKSDHVVFIMDFSGSMRRKTGTAEHDRGEGNRLNTPRIEVAFQQFAHYLRELDETHHFNVVIFSVGSRAAFQDLVPATEKNKAKALAFLGGLQLGGETDLFSGILKGLNVAGLTGTERCATGADTCYLLSDGIPTAGAVTHPADIVRILTRLNRGSGITLNVVDLGARHSAFQKHLRALALQNDGEYIRP